MPPSMPLRDRVIRNSMPEPNSGCWLWTGYVDPDGYAKTGAPWHTGHKMAFVAFVCDVPTGYEIDHICRNTSCVNPGHLRALPEDQHHKAWRRPRIHPNSLKTHCPKGHPLSGNNLVVHTGGRKCRTCVNDRTRQRSRERWEKGRTDPQFLAKHAERVSLYRANKRGKP